MGKREQVVRWGALIVGVALVALAVVRLACVTAGIWIPGAGEVFGMVGCFLVGGVLVGHGIETNI